MFSTHGSRMRYLSIYLMVAVTPENDARRPSRMSRLYSRPTRPPATSYCNRNLRSRLIFFGTLPTSNHDDGVGLSRPSPRGATAIPCKSGLRCIAFCRLGLGLLIIVGRRLAHFVWSGPSCSPRQVMFFVPGPAAVALQNIHAHVHVCKFMHL